MPTIKINAVFYVEGTLRGYPVNPIAICPTLIEMDTKTCQWNDTDRGNYTAYKNFITNDINLDLQKIRDFTIVTDEDERLRFYYLTKEVFEEKINKKGIAWGSPHFNTDEALQNHYLGFYAQTLEAKKRFNQE